MFLMLAKYPLLNHIMTTATAKTLLAAIAICALLSAVGWHIRNEPPVQRHLNQFQFLSIN
jgi:outer membrane lipopolysaccharide assembly protein LptE/RlpB